MESFTNILNESILDNDDVEAGLDKVMQDAKIKRLLTDFPVYEAQCDMTGRKLQVGQVVVFYPPRGGGNQLLFGFVKKVTTKRATLMVPAGTLYYVDSRHARDFDTVSLDTWRMFIIDDIDALLKQL